MRNNFSANIFIAISFFITISGKCQTEVNAYAVTDSIQKGLNWNYLRSIDLQTGKYSDVKLHLSDAFGKAVNGVAAIAYDKKNNRLYYTPMFQDHLLYVDLSTMEIVVVKENFTGLMPKVTDQSNIITRMVIDEDGNGYALTNDSRHLVNFSVKKNSIVTDRGTLIDAQGNNEMSVHNNCSSYGGDIVADDNGHLYLITSRSHVYNINISNQVATYIGTISGLSKNFITSGVTVENDDRLIVVSSVDSSDVYSLNMHSLRAKGMGVKNLWFASDLANSKILRSKVKMNESENKKIVFEGMPINYNESIRLYPNPVTSNEFKIHFKIDLIGTYNVSIFDTKGQKVLAKNIVIGGKNNTVSIILPESTSKGFFIVVITDNRNKTIYREKIVVN